MGKRFLSLILALLLFFISVPVGAFGFEPDGLIEDAEVDNLSPEMSPIDEDFYDSDSSGIKASPLKIQSDVLGDFSWYAVKEDPLPSRYDLREVGRVTSVKDQQVEGPCWAFATYGAMESYLKPFGDFDFSEKHLRDNHGFDWGAKDGGNRSISAAYFARWQGPISEADDPYDPVINVSPKDLERVFDIEKVVYLPDVNNIGDTDIIKRAVMKNGGVYTVMNSTSYFDSKENFSHYNPGGGRPNHGVVIVGWDDSFPASGFSTRAPGNGAWIIKNSWGTKYMDGGYFYVSYYDKFCGKSNAVFIPKNKDEKGHIYQHDPLGATRSVGYAGQGYMANIFTAKRNETLYEVGLFTVSNLTSYEIYVVKDVKRTSQLFKDRVKIAEGTIDYPGYYTIDVTPTELTEGQNFAIEVRMDTTSTDYRYPLPVETRVAGFSSKASANKGETYISSNGENWTDLTNELENANGCIKAITTTGDVPNPDDTEIVDPEKPINPIIKPTNMYFKEGNEGYIHINEKTVLHPVIEPADAEIEGINWHSLDYTIVAVTQDGTIYPRKSGNTSIIAQTKDRLVNCRILVQVVPEGFRVQDMTPLTPTGPNDYVEPEEPDNPIDPNLPPYDPDNPIDPGNPGPIFDDSVVRDISLTIPGAILKEGETFDIPSRVRVYPTEALYALSYKLSKPGIVSVDDKGILKALKPGYVNVDIVTDNGKKTTLKVTVKLNPDLHEIEIGDVEVSDRRGGIFTVSTKIMQGESGYTGPAEFVLASDDKVLTKTVYFKNGEGSYTYNGAQFGVWRDNFQGIISVRDTRKKFEFSFKDDKIVSDEERAYQSLPVYIESIEVSDRKAGLFTVTCKATQGDRGYTGKAEITLKSDDRILTKEMDFENGIGSYTFNGFQFGVWRKVFTGLIKIGDTQEAFEAVFP